MPEKQSKACDCWCCGHPILKKSIEFYCLIWGVIGIVFIIMMVWSLFQFKNLAAKGGWWMGGPGAAQGQYNYR